MCTIRDSPPGAKCGGSAARHCRHHEPVRSTRCRKECSEPSSEVGEAEDQQRGLQPKTSTRDVAGDNTTTTRHG